MQTQQVVNHLRKFSFVAVIFALVLTATVPIASGQRTAGTAIIDLGGLETTPPGATYQLSINGSDLANFAALSAVLHFDEDKFAFRSASVSEGRKGFLLSHNLHVHDDDSTCVEHGNTLNTCTDSEEPQEGELQIAFAGSKGLQGDHSLITLTFEAIGPNGDVGSFHLDELEAFAEDERPLATKASGSRFVYKNVWIHLPRISHRLPAKGDVNGDGKIRVDDVLRLLRSQVNRITLTRDEEYAADVGPLSEESCGDGRVGLADAQWILKATAGSVDLSPCGNQQTVIASREGSSGGAATEALPKGPLDRLSSTFSLGVGISETLIRQEAIEQEHLDLFGMSLAGVRRNSGRDWLVIGSPGESVPGLTGRARGKIYLVRDPGMPLGGNIIECVFNLPTDCISVHGDEPDSALGTSVGFGHSLPGILGAAPGIIQQGGTVLAGSGSRRSKAEKPKGRVYSFDPESSLLPTAQKLQIVGDGNQPQEWAPAPANWPNAAYPPSTGMGSSMATGDFNGDKADDIAVGAPSYPTRNAYLIYGDSTNGGARRSLDGGSSFNTLLGGSVKKIAMSTGFNTDGTMFSIGDQVSQFFKTENSGSQWNEVQLLPGVPFNSGDAKLSAIAMSKDYFSDQTLLVGTMSSQGPTRNIPPGALFSTGSGVSRSTNGGDSWAASNAGLNPTDLNITALATAKPRRAFLATGKGTFASSTDAGVSWTIAPNTIAGIVNDIEPMPNYGTWSSTNCTNCLAGFGIWLGTDQGIQVSFDSGQTWAASTLPGINVLDVAISPVRDYNGTWIVFAGTKNNGLFRAALNKKPTAQQVTNATWTPVVPGLTVNEIAVSSLFKQDGTAYAATSDGLYKTVDEGITWTKDNLSAPIWSETVALAQRTPAGAVSVIDGGSDEYAYSTQTLFDLEPAQSKDYPSAGDPFNGRKGDRFGHAVAAGDFNCDGYDDLAVGNPYKDYRGKDDAGVVFLMEGGPAGLNKPSSLIEHGRLSRLSGGSALFGYSLASGDLNGDGCGDLVVGAPRSGPEGKAEVFLGGPAGLLSAAVLDNGALKQDRSLFGFSVAIGDMDGDGKDDLAVGAPFYDSPSPFDNELRTDSGLVRIYLTGKTSDSKWSFAEVMPPDSAAAIEWPLAHAGSSYDRYGYALAFADLDDDGREELAAGAPYKALTGGPATQKMNAGPNVGIGDLKIRPGDPGLPTDGGAVFILDLTSKLLAKPLPNISIERPSAPTTRNLVAFIYRGADGENPDKFGGGWHKSTGEEPLSFLVEEWQALLEDTLNWDQLEATHHRVQYKIHFIDTILDDPLTGGDRHATCKAANPGHTRWCQFTHLLDELDKKGLLPPVSSIENDDGIIRVWALGAITGGHFANKPPSWSSSGQGITMASDTPGIGTSNLRYAMESSAKHELGHVLDPWPDHYGGEYQGASPYNVTGAGTHWWDRMSSGNYRHHLGFYKEGEYYIGHPKSGNIESIHRPWDVGIPIGNGYIETSLVLAPSESFAPGYHQHYLVECPPPTGKTHGPYPEINGLSIEFRNQIGADETLPDEGVLLTKVYLNPIPKPPTGIGADGLAWVLPRILPNATGPGTAAGPWFGGGYDFLRNNATLPWQGIKDAYANPTPGNAYKMQFSTPDQDLRIFAVPEVDPISLALTGNVVITVHTRAPSANAQLGATCWSLLQPFMTQAQQTAWQNKWG